MSSQNLVEQLEQYKNEYYNENTKNIVFKSNQKMDCAAKIAAQVSLEDLLSKTMFILPNTNKVFILKVKNIIKDLEYNIKAIINCLSLNF